MLAVCCLIKGLESLFSILKQIQDKSWDGVYVDLRQQTIPDRSHIKIVLRGPTERAFVPQPSSDPATARAEPVSCLVRKSIVFELILFSIQSHGACVNSSVISHGTQMHLGLGSSSGQLELKPPDIQVCLALVVCNVYILISVRVTCDKPAKCTKSFVVVYCMQEAQVVDLESDKKLSEDQIKEMAIIYRKTSTRPLTEYQKRMNSDVQHVCLKNPALLRKRQLLSDEARKKIIEDRFQFVKGKSRSKKGLSKNESEPKPKRQKMNQDVRDTRMKELEEMIKDYDERISFKERQITASLNISDYKACDELKDAVMELKKKKRELEAEMKHITVSNRQSRWYFQKKSGEGTSSNSKLSVSGSSTSSEPLSPLAYESSSDIASSSESTIGSEGSSLHLVVSESPVFGSSQKPRSRTRSVSSVFGSSQKPCLQARSVSLVPGSSQKPHSRAGSVSPGFGSSLKPCSRPGSVSPAFGSTQKPHSRGGSTYHVLNSTQKQTRREPAGVKPGECSRGSVARSSISSSPQSPDTCVMLTQKSTEILSSEAGSPDCTKRSDELDDCIVLSDSELSQLADRCPHSPELDINLIDSSNFSPTNASSQFPLFSQPEPSQEGHHSDSSDTLPFSPSLPAAQQQL